MFFSVGLIDTDYTALHSSLLDNLGGAWDRHDRNLLLFGGVATDVRFANIFIRTK